MPEIIGFAHEDATRLEVAGGKGASLARSARALPVPPGVIVAAGAYRAFMRPLEGRVRSVLEAHADPDAASERIQRLVSEADPDPDWLRGLAEALTEHGLDGHGVAVRSSGTMEDLPGAAFAGQHDTFLGVRGLEAIAEAVRGCYASLWNAHAMRYRDRLGLDHLQASMAVVVQRMVEVGAEEAAGVAFSIDPVRGDLGTVLVNAAFGLGETVVGGEAEVDEYLLSRDGSGVDAEDRAIRVARKPRALVADPSGGTREVELPEEQAERAALNAEQRAAVARLAVLAEEHFGFPQDIEWAVSGGELFLLQSRPVTRVAARWTRDESAERFPTPITPLTWDLVEAGFHASLNHSFALMGLPSFGDKWFAMRDSYIYGNQTAVELYSGRFPVQLFRDVDSIREALPEIARRYAWVQELPVQWMRDLDTYLIGIGRLSNEPLGDVESGGKDLVGLWEHVLEINDLGAAYFLPNIAISLTQRTLYAGLLRILSLGMPEDAAQAVFDRLLAQTDTKTGQVNAELWELSRLLRGTPGLEAWLDETRSAEGRTSQQLTDELRGRFPGFAAELDGFLARHGHRELDFDAYHPTWAEAPHIVIDQLRLLARREHEEQASPNQLRAAQ
ncbi:MAG: PEP/pyruvate-binding domain-containing protein, partial [Leucobacter sp.]